MSANRVVLVTGGAGYIGSHTVVELARAGYTPLIVDNFCNASRAVLPRLVEIIQQPLICRELDVTDAVAMRALLREVKPCAVIHFAALKAVGESVQMPLRYYRNNLDGLLSLIEAMQEAECFHLIFSSSATVYGDPARVPITEDMPTQATNPYGETKLMAEHILRDVARADLRWKMALLRYFNPIGAHHSGRIGEDPRDIPNNLLPYVAQVAVGRREYLNVFGQDYPTVDGTGVRDYIHVVDLARGHVAALEKIASFSGAEAVNLGTGQGYSVLEVVRAFEQASGQTVKYQIAPRRAGDIATCYADPTFAEKKLGWKAQYDLKRMCEDAWRWQSANPQGYE